MTGLDDLFNIEPLDVWRVSHSRPACYYGLAQPTTD